MRVREVRPEMDRNKMGFRGGRSHKVNRYMMDPCSSGLAVIREFIRATLTPFPPVQPHVLDIVSATHEACKNAVEHNPGSEHPVAVVCEVFEDSVVVEVTDRGGGFDPGILPPPPPDPEAPAGRGMYIIYSLMDGVDVEAGRDGTRLRIMKRF